MRSGGHSNPFTVNSIELSSNHQLAGQGIQNRLPMGTPGGADGAPAHAPDLRRGLALIGSSSINGLGLNPNIGPHIGSLQAIEQRPIKPAIKSAKHTIRPP